MSLASERHAAGQRLDRGQAETLGLARLEDQCRASVDRRERRGGEERKCDDRVGETELARPGACSSGTHRRP